ncbi:hypothetical protein NB706_003304 [Xanthomonas sacchari]|nr:hypothetical protein [Xanthomonas sacchari]
MLEASAQFLDGEHHAGQRRVERRGDAGGAAGQQEMAGLARIAKAEPAPEHVHQAGADVHGGTFAADRGAAEQGHGGQHQLARGHAQRQIGLAEAVVGTFQRGDHLRDAAAAGGAQCAVGQPGQQGEHARGQQQRPPRRMRGDALEHVEGGVAGLGEDDGDQGHRHRAAPQHGALLPALLRDQRAQTMAQARRLRGVGRMHAAIVARVAMGGRRRAATVVVALRACHPFPSMPRACQTQPEGPRLRAPVVASSRGRGRLPQARAIVARHARGVVARLSAAPAAAPADRRRWGRRECRAGGSAAGRRRRCRSAPG